jgi:hypothetical protein
MTTATDNVLSTPPLPRTEHVEPLDFSLHNRLDQPSLFTRLPRQAVKLILKNTSRSELTIPTGEPALILSFPPGTLWEPHVKLNAAEHAHWELRHLSSRGHFDRFELERKGRALKISADQTAEILLEDLQVDGRGGSRGTRVELVYKNLRSAGHRGKLSGQRTTWMSVLDEGPADLAPHLPIRVDLVGAQTLLNDDGEHALTVQLLCQQTDGLQVPAGAKITLEFPIADDLHPWGLLMSNQGLVDGSGEGTVQTPGPGTTWSVSIERQADERVPPRLVLTNQSADNHLAQDAAIRIPLRLKSNARSGYSFIQVTYENFGHLSDTQTVQVLKSPLVISDAAVGIGTDQPTPLFEVAGPLRVSGSNAQLHVAGRGLFDDRVGIGGVRASSMLDIWNPALKDTKKRSMFAFHCNPATARLIIGAENHTQEPNKGDQPSGEIQFGGWGMLHGGLRFVPDQGFVFSAGGNDTPSQQKDVLRIKWRSRGFTPQEIVLDIPGKLRIGDTEIGERELKKLRELAGTAS